MKKMELNQCDRRLKEFDVSLKQEVLDFVVEQRVAMLLKGQYVYASQFVENIARNIEHPRSSSLSSKSTQSNANITLLPQNLPPYQFIALLPDRKRLCFESSNSLDEKMAPFKLPVNFGINISEIEKITVSKSGLCTSIPDKKLRTTLELVTLVDAQEMALLEFYVDRQFDKLVWIDGLKMLMGKTDDQYLSSETLKQMSTLVDLRKSTQLLALSNEDLGEIDRESDDDSEFYNKKNLKNVLQRFFYAQNSVER